MPRDPMQVPSMTGNIKIVLIIEGDSANGRQAYCEMLDIAKSYGMSVLDVIIETDRENDPDA
jgi:hypothetical protein